jgi:hypothetical protein
MHGTFNGVHLRRITSIAIESDELWATSKWYQPSSGLLPRLNRAQFFKFPGTLRLDTSYLTNMLIAERVP